MKGGMTPPFTNGAQSQSFTYTPTRRLASASGYYGQYSWSYDGVGNRLTETANGVFSNYLYPQTSNQLQSVAAAGNGTRSLSYDAAGNVASDSNAAGSNIALNYSYDVEGRLSKSAAQLLLLNNGGRYGYDALDRLAWRAVLTPATTTTTLYVHDIHNHIIAELDTAGVTHREYVWLNDLPVAVVDGVNTGAPKLYYVHTDHLGRPARMTAQNQGAVWDVIYAPFGAVSYIWTNPETMDIRFPGQWFQLETGLAYNWRRHYDPSLGRYIQPDPLGLETLLSDGPSAYGYVGGNPLAYIDEDAHLAWFAAPIIGAVGSGLIDFGVQLYRHNGKLECVSVKELLGAVAAGAVLGSTGPSGLIFGRAGALATRLGYKGGFLNTGDFRIGWSWFRGANNFSIHGGVPRTSGHWHWDLFRGPSGPAVGEFGVGGAGVGGTVTGAAGALLGTCGCETQ
jgi:RHS repeat-associated protein